MLPESVIQHIMLYLSHPVADMLKDTFILNLLRADFTIVEKMKLIKKFEKVKWYRLMKPKLSAQMVIVYLASLYSWGG